MSSSLVVLADGGMQPFSLLVELKLEKKDKTACYFALELFTNFSIGIVPTLCFAFDWNYFAESLHGEFVMYSGRFIFVFLLMLICRRRCTNMYTRKIHGILLL